MRWINKKKTLLGKIAETIVKICTQTTSKQLAVLNKQRKRVWYLTIRILIKIFPAVISEFKNFMNDFKRYRYTYTYTYMSRMLVMQRVSMSANLTARSLAAKEVTVLFTCSWNGKMLYYRNYHETTDIEKWNQLFQKRRKYTATLNTDLLCVWRTKMIRNRSLCGLVTGHKVADLWWHNIELLRRRLIRNVSFKIHEESCKESVLSERGGTEHASTPSA